MHFTDYESAMKACRFCFMCRHLSAVGNVLYSEADTPRGRALMLDKASMDPEFLFNAGTVETLYRSDLSACCRFHCVSSYDETGLVLAARRDIAEAGKAPEAVKKLAGELAASSKFKVSKKADVLYFEDRYTASQKEVSAAFKKIASRAKVAYGTVSGGCIGKALKVLGYDAEGKKCAQAFAKAVAGARVLVFANPAAYDCVKNDFPVWGIKLNCKVLHVTEFIASLKLKAAKKGGKAYYLESDYLRNYNNNLPAPREVLASFGFKLSPFGTNNEESYSCGEGACVLPEVAPGLPEKLAAYVAARADDSAKDLLITASPYTRAMLKKAGLKVVTVEEAVAALL